MPCRRFAYFAIIVLLSSTSAWAADWPQFLGPNRDGASPETGLLKEWPAGGPKLKWKITDLGTEDAYSSVAVVNGRIYLMTQKGKEEYVVALDEKDGKKLWSSPVGKFGKNKQGYPYEGPRCTPTVSGEKIFALGSDGDIACLDLKGDKVWAKNLVKDFAGAMPWWSYSESPLVDGDAVIVSPGGSSATIVALNKKDGSVIWKSAVPAGKGGKGMGGGGGPKAAYGSPIRVDFGGIRQYVCVLESGLVSVAANDGKFLWRYDKITNSSGINPATPIFHNGIVFDNTGYGTGGGAVKLAVDQGKVTATEIWFEKDLNSAQALGGFVRVGDHIYGTAAAGKGGKGGGGVQLVCVELNTGKIVWKNASVGIQGSLCVAENMLYVRGENGKVELVEANPAAYKLHGRLDLKKAGKRPVWPYPAVANGCLYLRDMGVLSCYDIRDPGAKR
jgi:outer membrane protein assembly factor BamB